MLMFRVAVVYRSIEFLCPTTSLWLNLVRARDHYTTFPLAVNTPTCCQLWSASFLAPCPSRRLISFSVGFKETFNSCSGRVPDSWSRFSCVALASMGSTSTPYACAFIDVQKAFSVGSWRAGLPDEHVEPICAAFRRCATVL